MFFITHALAMSTASFVIAAILFATLFGVIGHGLAARCGIPSDINAGAFFGVMFGVIFLAGLSAFSFSAFYGCMYTGGALIWAALAAYIQKDACSIKISD